MIGALKRSWDNFRGGGEAAVTVPPMDGALRPNQLIEQARQLVRIEAPDDLAQSGQGVLFSAGTKLCRPNEGGHFDVLVDLGSEVTALATSSAGLVAAATVDGRIVVSDTAGVRRSLERLGAGRATCVTALCFASEDELLVAQGSGNRDRAAWKRDLMERRSDGSVWRVSVAGDAQARLAERLGWPFGIALAGDGRILVSESWRHRIVAVAEGRRPEAVLSDLPGYPARIHRDPQRGGYWLALFAPRNQIIEFVQREPAFLARMMAEVEEPYWAAPSLTPSRTFLEPLQGGAQKHLGMLKPWAPTRSYGLVARLDDNARPVASYHSRADGTRHGIFTCLPVDGKVLVAARGGDVIVQIDPDDVAGTPRQTGEA